VRVKPSLTALDLSTNPAHTFRTPQLKIIAVRVRSALALAVTNGSWQPDLNPIAPRALELPPDGAVELSFSHPVDRLTLARVLILDPPAKCALRSISGSGLIPDASISGASLFLDTCALPAPECVSVSLRCVGGEDGARAALLVGAVHRLVLREGSPYQWACGATRRKLAVPLTGLVPFSIPFTQLC
jgi:hypothetical protein